MKERQFIRKLIISEIQSMVGEDAIISPSNTKDSYRFNRLNRGLANTNQKMIGGDLSIPFDSCSQCGCEPCECQGSKSIMFGMFEGGEEKCNECGGMMYEGECNECGSMSSNFLNEDCGCGSCPGCNKKSDYSVGSMVSMLSGEHSSDESGQLDSGKYHDNNYMAKPSLYKVAKYASKLLKMIPDGYELDDWQRSKIAEIADDISEVYHSLDYDFKDGDY